MLGEYYVRKKMIVKNEIKKLSPSLLMFLTNREISPIKLLVLKTNYQHMGNSF